MSESIWQREECSPGRRYMLGKDPYVRYDDEEAIVATIINGLKEFIHAEPAVRITLDSPLANAERVVIAVPFEADAELILHNFAKLIYQSLMGYYISSEPQTSHFGIANTLIEGSYNSLLRREMEKLIDQLQSRSDMAGRLLENVKLIGKMQVPTPGKTYLTDTLENGLDIHVGYRVYAMGKSVNYTKIFLPLETGKEIIELLYYNLEQILHQNFVTYDEIGDAYLDISETLVFRELESVLNRAKSKELTRKKIINNLQFNTMLLDVPVETDESLIGDNVYDYLNHIQDIKLQEQMKRSRELYTIHAKETSVTLQQLPQSLVEIEKAEEEEKEKTTGPQSAPDMESLFSAREQARQQPRTSVSRSSVSPARTARQPIQVPTPPEEGRRVPTPDPAPRTPTR